MALTSIPMNPQPNISLHSSTMDTGQVHHIVRPFTDQLSLVITGPTLGGWPGWVSQSGWLAILTGPPSVE